MLAYLKRQPGCRVLLVEKTDRLSRNLQDMGAVEALGIEVHLVKENAIYSKDSRSSDKLMHGLKVLMAKTTSTTCPKKSRRACERRPRRACAFVCATGLSEHGCR